jgi:hypothetical protein
MALIVYEKQLIITNAYVGFVGHQMDLYYLFRIVFGCIALWVVMPDGYGKPSDYLPFIYAMFVLAPFVFFDEGHEGVFMYIVGVALIALPLLGIKFFGKIGLPVLKMGLVTETQLVKALAVIVVVALLSSYLRLPSTSGLSLEDSYVRRLAGRTVFLPGTIIAYALSITANGVGPFLAFKAGYKGKISMIVLIILIPVALYYLLGLKAPFAYVLMSYFFGYMVYGDKHISVPRYLFAVIVILFSVFVIEYSISGYSLVGEYTFRRYFVVNGRDAGKYLEMVFGQNGWTFFSGVNCSQGVAYMVGKLYYTESANVNTNALIYAFSGGGVPFYLLVVCVIFSYYLLLDRYYKKYGDPVYLFLGLFYALIISEQSATTALASSGYALLLVLSIIESSRKKFSLQPITDKI